VTTLAIRKPDDWHVHFRDGEVLKAVAPYTAAHFKRAIVMPNLLPPVTTAKMAADYRKRILAATAGSGFVPLMTCYLTDDTDPDDVERGFRGHRGLAHTAPSLCGGAWARHPYQR